MILDDSFGPRTGFKDLIQGICRAPINRGGFLSIELTLKFEGRPALPIRKYIASKNGHQGNKEAGTLAFLALTEIEP